MVKDCWRLPTKDNCLTIEGLDEACVKVFRELLQHNDDIFWTSDSHETQIELAYVFDMLHCSTRFSEKYEYQRTRLVRSSQEIAKCSDGQFKLSECGTFVTDFISMIDWQVKAQPQGNPWPRAMWKYNHTNVLKIDGGLDTSILVVQNALIGRPESFHMDVIVRFLKQSTGT